MWISDQQAFQEEGTAISNCLEQCLAHSRGSIIGIQCIGKVGWDNQDEFLRGALGRGTIFSFYLWQWRPSTKGRKVDASVMEVR